VINKLPMDLIVIDVQAKEVKKWIKKKVGWDRGRRVRGNLIYIVLQAGKVVIEYDGIEHGVSTDLVAQGVMAQDIVLAFLEESSVANAA